MMLRLSVVIPARNAAPDLGILLAALASQWLPGDECIVVDDASSDRTARIAHDQGVAVLSLPRCAGPAAARNAGAERASGDALVFLDADVVPHPGLLDRIRDHLLRSPGLTAVFGSYDANPNAPSTVSRFRNLLHCYTHRHGSPDASTFWAGCGAIRRADFLRVGGFDAERFPEPSVEDIELGLRIKRSGGRILLDPALQAQHRKAWTFAAMLRADLFHRAIPWAGLILEDGAMPPDLNLKVSQRFSAASVACAAAAGLLAPLAPRTAAVAVPALLAAVVLLNVRFYRFLAASGGWPFAVRAAPLHWSYYVCAVAGFGIAWTQSVCRRLFRATAARLR